MAIEWVVEVDGQRHTHYGSRIHVAVHRALARHPLPAVGQVVVIRAWRVRTVPPVKRRGY